MKKLITLLSFGLMISLPGHADVGQNRHTGDTGTAAVDEHYLDALSKKDSAPDRVYSDEKSKTGYEHLNTKEKDQQRQEEGRSVRPLK